MSLLATRAFNGLEVREQEKAVKKMEHKQKTTSVNSSSTGERVDCFTGE
jgi:hypothetical protein